MRIEPYLNLSIQERTSHLTLDELCVNGGPVTGRKLGAILDVDDARDVVPIAICGNKDCANPLHYAFCRKHGEKRNLKVKEKERRLRHLLLNTQFRHASIKALAAQAHCSRIVVRRILVELGLTERAFVQGQNGKVIDPKKYHAYNSKTKQTEAG